MSNASGIGPDHVRSPDWASHVLALFATVLCAAGVIAMVAANWSEFGRWPRLAILAFATISCLVGAGWLTRFDGVRTDLFKHMAAAMGAVFAGVSAALVGQAWQLPLEWNGVLITSGWVGLAAALLLRSTPTAWLSIAAMIAWASVEGMGRSRLLSYDPVAYPSLEGPMLFIAAALAGAYAGRIKAASGTFFLLLVLGVASYANGSLFGMIASKTIIVGPLAVALCVAVLSESLGKGREARGIIDAAIVGTIAMVWLSSIDFGSGGPSYRPGPDSLGPYSVSRSLLTPTMLGLLGVAFYAWRRRDASASASDAGLIVLALFAHAFAALHRHGFQSMYPWILLGHVLPLLLVCLATARSGRSKTTILAAVALVGILGFQIWRAKVLSEIGIVTLAAGLGLSAVLWIVPRVGGRVSVAGREISLNASWAVPALIAFVLAGAIAYLAYFMTVFPGAPAYVSKEIIATWSWRGSAIPLACAAILALAALYRHLEPMIAKARGAVPKVPLRPHAVVLVLSSLLALSAVIPSLKLALGRDRILAGGTEVVLAVETRDPRSLFRGDYSKLVYKIGRLDGTPVEGGVASVCDPARLASLAAACLATGRDVYAILERTPDGVHAIRAVSFERPEPGSLFIRGKLSGTTVFPRGRPKGPGRPPCEAEACINGSATYGIETWFGREGLPAQLDRAARADVRVVVRVSPSGDAVIDKVTVENVELAPTR